MKQEPMDERFVFLLQFLGCRSGGICQVYAIFFGSGWTKCESERREKKNVPIGVYKQASAHPRKRLMEKSLVNHVCT